MNAKNLRRILIFAVLVICLLIYLSMVFTFPRGQKSDMARERFNTFYALPDNTVDGLFIGTSGVDRYWIPQLAWKENGITVYGMTSGNQPLPFVKHLMTEALKSQDIKTFIVDIRAVSKKPASINDTDVRRVTDNLRMSANKIETTKDILEFLENGKTKVKTDDLSYYIKLAKYHAGWKDLTKEDFIDVYPESEYMGYFAYNDNAFKVRPQKITTVIDDTAKLDPRNEAALIDLLDYCDTLDAEVIFVSSPQSPRDLYQKQYNEAFRIIKSRGYKTINFNTDKMYSAVGWDFHHDLYNHGHANIYGAIKYTRWIADYLQDKYKLEDHRKDADQSQYEIWDQAYENTMDRLKEFDKAYYKEIYIK